MPDEFTPDEFMPDESTPDESTSGDRMNDEDLEEEPSEDENLPLISPPIFSVEALRQHIAPPPPRADFLPPVDDPEVLRVLAVGSRTVVNVFVHRLHQAGIAHFSEWSRLLPTPNPGEFMRLLTKRIPLDRLDRADQN